MRLKWCELQHFYKFIEEVGCVGRAGSCFGVELARKEGKAGVADAFVSVIVEVFEPGAPGLRERFGFDRETVILGGDVAMFVVRRCRVNILNGLVLGAMAEFELVCCCAGGEGEDLIAEADAENRFL